MSSGNRPSPSPTTLNAPPHRQGLPLDIKFRLLALLPLLFFVARVIEYVVIAHTPEQILWCCHVSNLLLAVGLASASPRIIRIAVIWLLLGIPPWVLDMVMTGLITPISIFTHLGSAALSLVAIRVVGMKSGAWLQSLLYFIILQQLTRLATVPGPYTNVNVAHFAYGPLKDIFTKYWIYLLVNSLIVALALWLIERLLIWWAPVRGD